MFITCRVKVTDSSEFQTPEEKQQVCSVGFDSSETVASKTKQWVLIKLENDSMRL